MIATRDAGILERDLVGTTRAQIASRNQLSRQRARLSEVLRDCSLADVRLVQADGPPADSRWRLLLKGPQGELLRLALPPAVLERVGAADTLRPPLRQALAAQLLAPMLPGLARFFGQDLAPFIEPVTERGADTSDWLRFHVLLPGIDHPLLAQMPQAFAERLIAVLAAARRDVGVNVQVRLFAAHCLCLPVTTVRSLCVGDVLLVDETASYAASAIRLHVESASTSRQARYLATVRAEDGRVLHLADAGRSASQAGASGLGPRVQVEMVEARLVGDAAGCRALALGQRFDAWDNASWLIQPELRVGGTSWGYLRRTRVAGRIGFEVLALHAPVQQRADKPMVQCLPAWATSAGPSAATAAPRSVAMSSSTRTSTC